MVLSSFSLTDGGIVEDLGVASIRILSSELPDVEERLPIDVRHQDLKIHILEHLFTDKLRLD